MSLVQKYVYSKKKLNCGILRMYIQTACSCGSLALSVPLVSIGNDPRLSPALSGIGCTEWAQVYTDLRRYQ